MKKFYPRKCLTFHQEKMFYLSLKPLIITEAHWCGVSLHWSVQNSKRKIIWFATTSIFVLLWSTSSKTCRSTWKIACCHYKYLSVINQPHLSLHYRHWLIDLQSAINNPSIIFERGSHGASREPNGVGTDRSIQLHSQFNCCTPIRFHRSVLQRQSRYRPMGLHGRQYLSNIHWCFWNSK